jgi:hypothetical protein
MQPDRPLQLQQLTRPLLGRIEFPPKLETEQSLVEAAGPFSIRDAQPNMIENRHCRSSQPP